MTLPDLTVPAWAAVAVVAITLIAADTDFRSRRIPNALTLTAILAALVAHAIAGGVHGLTQAGLGMLVGGGILLPGWLMGWMGAGDVKLMAAVGAWLAWPASLTATLVSLIAGGVFALAVAAKHRSLGRSLRGALHMGAWAAVLPGRKGPPPAASDLRFPFAGAILAGSMMSLWLRL
jgi:prepilin peptidase CpaA